MQGGSQGLQVAGEACWALGLWGLGVGLHMELWAAWSLAFMFSSFFLLEARQKDGQIFFFGFLNYDKMYVTT